MLSPSLLSSYVPRKTVVSIAKEIDFRPKAMFLTSAPSDPDFVENAGK